MFEVHEYGNKHSDKVMFFFSGIDVNTSLFNKPYLPIRVFAKKGWRVIAYQYPWQVINTATSYMNTLNGVFDDASKRIMQLNPDSRVIAVGMSLGSLPATRFATTFRQVDGLILNVPYADPITNMHDYEPTRKVPKDFAEKFINTAISLEELERQVEPYSPLRQAKHMRHLKVVLFAAQQDKWFLYKYALQLRDEIGKYTDHLAFFSSKRLNHITGSSKFNFCSKYWLDWLDNA